MYIRSAAGGGGELWRGHAWRQEILHLGSSRARLLSQIDPDDAHQPPRPGIAAPRERSLVRSPHKSCRPAPTIARPYDGGAKC